MKIETMNEDCDMEVVCLESANPSHFVKKREIREAIVWIVLGNICIRIIDIFEIFMTDISQLDYEEHFHRWSDS